MIRWLIAVLMLGVFAQDESIYPPIAAYQADGGLYVFNMADEPIYIADGDTTAVWGNDYLAYYAAGVFIAPLDDLRSPLLVAEVEYPPRMAFDDGRLLYSDFGEWEDAPQPEGMTGTWLDAPLIVEAFDGSTTERVDAYLPLVHGRDLMAGNPADFQCPIFGVSWMESRWVDFLLADTPQGLVTYYNRQTYYQYEPRLQVGDARLDVPSLANAALAGDQLVFVVDGAEQIGTVDLASLEMTLYDLPHEAEAIGGDGGRYIYYSVRIEGEESLILDDEWRAYHQFDYLSCWEYINTVELYQFDTQTQTEALIYSGVAHSIPWLMVVDGGLYFTVVPNGEAWREKMVNEACEVEECLEMLMPNLYYLDVETLDVDLVLEGVLMPVIMSK